MVEEFDAQEIWADYERGYCKLSKKEFVESKHYFDLRKAVKDFIEDNRQLAELQYNDIKGILAFIEPLQAHKEK